MSHLEEVSISDLQAALDRAEGKKPTQRLITAIAYKNGVTQTELAEWYGVQRRTIYNWLTRFDEREIESAIRDDDRSGRPRKLTPDQQAELYDALGGDPETVDIDASAWSPELVQTYVRDRFDVRYSLSSCRRLLDEATGAGSQTV